MNNNHLHSHEFTFHPWNFGFTDTMLQEQNMRFLRRNYKTIHGDRFNLNRHIVDANTLTLKDFYVRNPVKYIR